jgi:hypothetical protein
MVSIGPTLAVPGGNAPALCLTADFTRCQRSAIAIMLYGCHLLSIGVS